MLGRSVRWRRGGTVKVLAAFGLLASVACQGSISCSGCGGGNLPPVPGGFPDEARIARAAQVRLTRTGLDFIQTSFQDLVSAYGAMKCGPAEDVPCPTGFHTLPGGQPRPTTCDPVADVCVANGVKEPILGFEIEQSQSSGAVICRDDVADPNRRRCYAWVRPEAIRLEPRPSDALEATISVQLYTSGIPFRYSTIGMDCIVTMDSSADGMPIQDLVMTATLGAWRPPGGGNGGGQLEVAVTGLTAMIPNDDVRLERDPVHGGIDDFVSCGLANLGVVKNALIPRFMETLSERIDQEVRKSLGWRCGRPMTEPCPTGTRCNGDGLCEEIGRGVVIPQKLGFEARADLADLLMGLAPGFGVADLAFLVGGQSTTDATGANIGMLGGVEVVAYDPSCAARLPSPRLRPGFTPPPALPADAMVDLDFDGTPERSYMVAAGLSQAIFDQSIWMAYSTGLFCSSISSYDIDLLNTGSLAVLMPSLDQLTHKDRFSWSVWPARVSIQPSGEPTLRIGSGKVTGQPNMPRVEEPLLELAFQDLRLDFSAIVEERWVHLMTVTADVKIPLGVTVTPANELQILLGDIESAVTDIHVTAHDILAESTMELEDAVPSLLSLVLPQVTGALAPGFSLPGGPELGGFGLNVLGIRGVQSGGTYPNLAIYADLDFDPAQVPNLSVAADTLAEVARVHLPSSEELSVRHPGGPVRPRVELSLGGFAPSGGALEHQIRIDGGLWSTFFTSPMFEVATPELLIQGEHRIEVRARVIGDYRTLDPTPVELDVVIDTEPPELWVDLDERAGGARVRAYDVVAKEQVRLELGVDGVFRDISPDERGFVAIPELGVPLARIEIRASDPRGLARTRVLHEGVDARAELQGQGHDANGCRCAGALPNGAASHAASLLVLFGVSFAVRLRRRRR